MSLLTLSDEYGTGPILPLNKSGESTTESESNEIINRFGSECNRHPSLRSAIECLICLSTVSEKNRFYRPYSCTRCFWQVLVIFNERMRIVDIEFQSCYPHLDCLFSMYRSDEELIQAIQNGTIEKLRHMITTDEDIASPLRDELDGSISRPTELARLVLRFSRRMLIVASSVYDSAIQSYSANAKPSNRIEQRPAYALIDHTMTIT